MKKSWGDSEEKRWGKRKWVEEEAGWEDDEEELRRRWSRVEERARRNGRFHWKWRLREVSRKTKYGFSVRSDGWQEKFRRQGRYNKEESIELKLGRGELGKGTQAVRHENNRKCSKEVRPNNDWEEGFCKHGRVQWKICYGLVGQGQSQN